MTADPNFRESLPLPSSPQDEQLFGAADTQLRLEPTETGRPSLRLITDSGSEDVAPDTTTRPSDMVHTHLRDLQLLRRLKVNVWETNGTYDTELLNGLARRLIIPALRVAEEAAGLEPTDTSEFEHQAPER